MREWDVSRSYFRANSIQRSNVTAAALAAGLLTDVGVPVHSYPLGQTDPVFDPIAAKVVAVDAVRAANEVRQVYNSGAALASAYSGEFSLIRSVLFDYPVGVEPPPPRPRVCWMRLPCRFLCSPSSRRSGRGMWLTWAASWRLWWRWTRSSWSTRMDCRSRT